MSDQPVPRDPGQDDDPPGVPVGPGDRPWLGSPNWQLVPQSPDWPEWMDHDAHAGDEDPATRTTTRTLTMPRRPAWMTRSWRCCSPRRGR